MPVRKKQLTGTETDEPNISTDRETLPGKPDEKLPEKPHSETGESDEQSKQAGFSAEAEQSLVWLRDKMDFPQTMFGVALLGYTGETSDGDWISEVDRAMLQKYPFISEIDTGHIIGNDDYLYCLVPIDENATVSVNLMRWDPKSDNEEVIEVLYRSESGDPVLLFAAGGDDAYAYLSYVEIQIVDNAGKWHGIRTVKQITTCGSFPRMRQAERSICIGNTWALILLKRCGMRYGAVSGRSHPAWMEPVM